ncbi:ABC transporter substrate-binding protein [Sphingomonas xanthus]|uniref:ABC transporter substrate-binding protein n=1 Tax=Sphingomonas xanthus TaxID=2594473 RepID=UPI00164D9EDC|nr:ABC transporter substrate-binding protein [Sphingomonas xanthus]
MSVSVLLLAASTAVRAASLNLCTDEYLLLLAGPGQVASVSRLSQDPADSALWKIARRYPANRGSLEDALSTRPTLLLTMGGGGRATSEIARRLQIATLDLPFPANVTDVERNMIRVASALGGPSLARPWQQRLAALRRAPSPSPIDTIFLAGSGLSLSPGSPGAEWMDLAGFRQRRLAGGRATLESLTMTPPAILLRSSYRRAQRSQGRAWLDHPLARPRGSRLIETDGRPWTCAGPLMLAEIERLKGLR